MLDLPERQRLYHTPPSWVKSGALFFVTVCAAHRGANTLARDHTSPALLASAAHYHNSAVWWLRLLVLMPDHLHALLALPVGRKLGGTITAWKSYQTKQLGVTWQPGFFDHRIRSNESLEEKARYIRLNPVRAGLVTATEDWPYVWEPPQGTPVN